jgi:circadian clock protein KaiB
VEDLNQPVAGSEKHQFILFVSGMSVKSIHAVENLRRICEQHLAGNFEIEIIDIGRAHQKAVEHQIIAIPTLIRTHPGPSKMILGDLSETDKVLKILDIPI